MDVPPEPRDPAQNPLDEPIRIVLPNDSRLAQEIRDAGPTDGTILFLDAATDEPADIRIGSPDPSVSAAGCLLQLVDEEASATRLAWSAQADEEPPRFAAPVRLGAELWRVLLPPAIEVARLRRRIAASTRLAHHLDDQAHTDPLTELANRRGWERALRDWSQQPNRRPAVCMILDVDHFKRCNDDHGHKFGDQVLRVTAATLRIGLRQGDCLARIGGDEFAAWLPGVDSEHAVHIVERIRQRAVKQLRDTLGEAAPTLSTGAAIAGVKSVAEQALRQADEALLEAKRAGRNRGCLAGAPGQ